MEPIKKIDIHAHVTPFPEYAPPLPHGGRFVSAEDLIGFYEILGIEKGVLLPLATPEATYDTFTTQDCQYIANKYPDRFLWFCHVDPRAMTNTADADLSYLLKHYKSLGALGMGELTAQLYMDDPKVDNLFSHLVSCDMPVTIHIAPRFDQVYGLVDEHGLFRLEKMLKKHPQLKLLGHSAAFWSQISADVTPEEQNGYPTGPIQEGRIAQLLRECPNLYCDISASSGLNAMTRDRAYAARFMEEFSERILYGCDFCARECEQFIKEQLAFDEAMRSMVERGEIREETYYNIFRGNATRLLNLKE